jgi:integration host factor subunit beta
VDLPKLEKREIRRFGSYSVRNFKTYRGRNPKTGEEVMVKSIKLLFFKVGKRIEKKGG